MGFLTKMTGAVKDAARFVSSKSKALTIAGLVALGATSAFADGAATTYSPVSKDAASGSITFTPTNIINPIVDGVVSSYSAWAVLVVIIIVVGLMIWIFKKK